MTTSEIRKKTLSFKKEFGIKRCVSSALYSAIEKQGYTIVEYNNIYNDENVEQLLDALKLKDVAKKLRGFTYADRNYRIVFLHDSLSESEKTIVLAHEAGHIYLSHLSSEMRMGRDVQEEYEANEFAHYLLNPPSDNRRAVKTVCAVSVLLLAVLGALVIRNAYVRGKYYGDFYVTSSGEKYHERQCIFVRNKTNIHRLTKEEFEDGKYEPCKVCLP